MSHYIYIKIYNIVVFLIGLITKHGQVPYGKGEHGKKAIIYIWLIGGKRNLQRLQDQGEC